MVVNIGLYFEANWEEAVLYLVLTGRTSDIPDALHDDIVCTPRESTQMRFF